MSMSESVCVIVHPCVADCSPFSEFVVWFFVLPAYVLVT